MRKVLPLLAALLLCATASPPAAGDVPPACPEAVIESASTLTVAYGVGYYDLRYRGTTDPLCQAEEDALVGDAVAVRWFRDQPGLQDVTVEVTAWGDEPVTVTAPLAATPYIDLDEAGRERIQYKSDHVALPPGFQGLVTATIFVGEDAVATVAARHA